MGGTRTLLEEVGGDELLKNIRLQGTREDRNGDLRGTEDVIENGVSSAAVDRAEGGRSS
jgi:hypothetical protein